MNASPPLPVAPSPPLPWLGLSPAIIQLTAAAAILASLVGQGLSAALLGARAGLEGWIVASDFMGAFTSQFFAVLGVVVAMQLVTASVRSRELPFLYRFLIVPAAGLVLLLCVAATQRTLPDLFLLGSALVSGLVLFFAAALAVGHASTRLLGLALGFSGFCTIIRALSSLLQVLPSGSGSPPNALAWLSLISFLGLLLTAGAWLDLRRNGLNRILLALALVLALLLVFMAEGARKSSSAFLPVLVQRTLENLQTLPAPWADGPLSQALTALVLPLATVLLFTLPRGQPLAAALSLTLLARGSADIPALGLQLMLAALMAGLAVAQEASPLMIHRDNRGEKSD